MKHKCPSCGRSWELADSLVGRRVTCEGCGAESFGGFSPDKQPSFHVPPPARRQGSPAQHTADPIAGPPKAPDAPIVLESPVSGPPIPPAAPFSPAPPQSLGSRRARPAWVVWAIAGGLAAVCAVVALAILLGGGASSKIVGKWREKNGRPCEFFKDGTMLSHIPHCADLCKGTWRFLDDRRLEVHSNMEVMIFDVAFEGDKALLKGLDGEMRGEVLVFTKVTSSLDVPTPQNSITVDLGGGVKMELVLIPAGSFLMGSEKGDPDEKPVHKVKIPKAFYMGKYEVTQEQWQAVNGNNPSNFKGQRKPVDTVNPDSCREFLRKLNEAVKNGRFTLPTEAEWEYACRAGSKTEFCSGDDEKELGEYAWYAGNSDRMTHPVGGKKPNAWGLFDMHGNVWEYCKDVPGGSYERAPTDGSAWTQGGDPADCVKRGGSWYGSSRTCRSANRSGVDPGPGFGRYGVRVVLRDFSTPIPNFTPFVPGTSRRSQPSTEGNRPSIPVKGAWGGGPLGPLDYEAAKLAVDLWKPTRLGDSYYVYSIEVHPSVSFSTSPAPKDIRKIVYELRQIALGVEPVGLDEADKLNGLEWRGAVRLYAKASRRNSDYRYLVGPPPNTWSEWAAADVGHVLGIECEKRNGKWKILRGVSEGDEFKQVDPSDIPK